MPNLDKRAYFKVDVGYFDNPKITDLVEDNPRAVLLHLRAIAYCAQHLTDGVFPMRLVMRMACGSHGDMQCLTDRGLVNVLDGTNAHVHDYLEHQRSSADAHKAKAAGQAGAIARWDADRNATSNADRIATSNADTNSQREREREREKDTSADADPPRADVLDLCAALSEALTHNSVKHTNGKAWYTAARLLLDKDRRDCNEVIEVIDFATTDSFWIGNVHSMLTLRTQYDKLRLQMNRAPNLSRQGSFFKSEMARLAAKEPATVTNLHQIGAGA